MKKARNKYKRHGEKNMLAGEGILFRAPNPADAERHGGKSEKEKGKNEKEN